MWYYLPINPEPWAVGPVGVGKKNGKFYPYVGRNNQLDSFKQAVKEELQTQGVKQLAEGNYKLTFYFSRRLESNTSGSKMNYADATNMQKATEDALQGVLFDNDRNVSDVRSVILQQSETAKPAIIIEAEYLSEGAVSMFELPLDMLDKYDAPDDLQTSDNVWPPR